jgi:hypothetical protein
MPSTRKMLFSTTPTAVLILLLGVGLQQWMGIVVEGRPGAQHLSKGRLSFGKLKNKINEFFKHKINLDN